MSHKRNLETEACAMFLRLFKKKIPSLLFFGALSTSFVEVFKTLTEIQSPILINLMEKFPYFLTNFNSLEVAITQTPRSIPVKILKVETLTF